MTKRSAEEVAARLLRRVAGIKKALGDAMVDMAADWEQTLKKSFKPYRGDPVGPGIHVRTGALRNSIRFVRIGEGLKTAVRMFTAGVPYARIHAFPRRLKSGIISNAGQARFQFFETWNRQRARRQKRLRAAVDEGIRLA